MNRLRIARDAGTVDYVGIEWDQAEDSEEFLAYRRMPGVNQRARIPELDVDSLLKLFVHQRDFLTRMMDEEAYTPGETG